MEQTGKMPLSQAELARRAHCDQRTIGRILSMDMSPTADMLDRIAQVFGLEAWQMMVPGLDPTNPPVNHFSEEEKRFYDRLKEAALAFAEEDRSPYRK
jgi:transcriptional regulator with XRE-family HTH domain